MIRPGCPVPMWAIQDRLLGTYMGPPLVTLDEALTVLLASNAGRTTRQISLKFDVVPVEVTLLPRHGQPPHAGQFRLFAD